jgi:hypothetical protein
MVTNVSRAWVRTGADPRPLHVRHAEAADALVKLGGNAIHPQSENSIDQMQLEIAQKKKSAAPVWDERVAEAGREFLRYVARYQTLYLELEKDRLRLDRMRTDPAHELLGDLEAALAAVPVHPQEMINKLFGKQAPQGGSLPGKLDVPDFFTVPDYRAATARMVEAVNHLTDIAARTQRVFHYESIGTPEQNRQLIWALYTMVNAMAERIDYLETIVTTKPKQRKAS